MNYGDWPPTLSFASYIAIAKFSLRRNAKSVLQPRACASVWQSVRLIILSFKKLSIISDRELLSGSLCLFSKEFTSLSVGSKQGRRQRGCSGAGSPIWNRCPPHFTFGPPAAAYIQYCIFKMWPPLLVFGPSFWFLAPLQLNPGDGPGSKAFHLRAIVRYIRQKTLNKVMRNLALATSLSFCEQLKKRT